jgi:predicted RNase H-like HicB family nuclease
MCEPPVALHVFTAIIEADDGGFKAWAAEVPGAYAKGSTLEEVRANLRQSIEWLLEEHRRAAFDEVATKPAIMFEPIVMGASPTRRIVLPHSLSAEDQSRLFSVLLNLFDFGDEQNREDD